MFLIVWEMWEFIQADSDCGDAIDVKGPCDLALAMKVLFGKRIYFNLSPLLVYFPYETACSAYVDDMQFHMMLNEASRQ